MQQPPCYFLKGGASRRRGQADAFGRPHPYALTLLAPAAASRLAHQRNDDHEDAEQDHEAAPLNIGAARVASRELRLAAPAR